MKSVIPKFLSFVMMTTAMAVAADSSSSSTLATTLASEEDDARARTTTPPLEGFEASSWSSLSSSSVVEDSGATQQLTSYNGTDGGAGSAPRKLAKSSKKVRHSEALCTLRLFADSVFMYENKCFADIMVTISACDDKDDTCYISERLPLLPQEENQEEEQCFVGGLFPAKQNIRYNPSTGDCEFLYVDLTVDPCNMYTDDDGAGSLGLKARINVETNPNVMFIQFTNDNGLTFYNIADERVAVRTTTHDNRYLHQDGKTQPVLSMVTHPHSRRRRRMTDGCNDVGDTSFAEMEKEDCWTGPCNKIPYKNACLGGTFTKGCKWYPNQRNGNTIGMCSSCAGVNCGNHRALTCYVCEYYDGKAMGKNYCNGECTWDNRFSWFPPGMRGGTLCGPK